MPLPAMVGGVLPPGRHICDQLEIKEVFVLADEFAASKSRTPLWQHWEAAIGILASAVIVHRAWISGSFTTDKVNPRDIDVVFIVSGEDRDARSDTDKKIVESFIRRVPDSLGKMVPAHRLLVDSFVVDWRPHHESKTSKEPLSPEYLQYARERGYWDDFWSRKRHSPKSAPPVRLDALPARGYLEVSFDDFQ